MSAIETEVLIVGTRRYYGYAANLLTDYLTFQGCGYDSHPESRCTICICVGIDIYFKKYVAISVSAYFTI